MERVERKVFITFCIVLGSVLLFVIGYLFYNAYRYPMYYKESILQYSKEFDLDPSLVAGVINAESRFDKDAVSSKGAVGLMQLMPSTAVYMADSLGEKLVVENLTDSDTNIRLGCCYLDYLMDKFDSVETVLASYNAGEGVVKRWLKSKEYSPDGKTLANTPYPETNAYIDKVLNAMKVYENKLSD